MIRKAIRDLINELCKKTNHGGFKFQGHTIILLIALFL